MFRILFCVMNIFVMLGIGSCKKFVEVPPPPTQLVSQNVFESDGTATAAILGIYSDMQSNFGFASGTYSSISFLAGGSSDELTNYSTDANQIQFYNNALSRTNSTISSFLWANPYKYIYASNAALEGLFASTQVSTSVKTQLVGEAKFIRAFCYFYLVNLFGDVPLVTSSNYLQNDTASRASTSLVYQQIILDLKDAQQDLSPDYSFSNGERVRPNKWAATSLLARAYLYEGNWQEAETQSSEVINNTSLYNLVPDLNSVFLANSNEAIWQEEPVLPGLNTNEGSDFILTANPVSQALNIGLVADFEPGDQRRISWVDSITESGQTYYFPFKYKIQSGATVTEYSMVFRLAELYLIRAEARVYLNNLSGAEDDLNIIRNRAGLSNTGAADNTTLLNAIMQERRVELFTEWGHRWLDLKRTRQADSVLALQKPQWQTTSVLYPIPQSEIQNDPNLSQNPGY